MPDISVQGTPATCGHPQTGSSRVTIEGKGVSRVENDTAGGLIIGPGSQNVFVEGMKVSLQGDAIPSHGKSPHAAPRTIAGQTRVTAGTGFAGDSNTTGEAPKADLQMVTFAADKLLLAASGQGHYPPTNMGAARYHCWELAGGTNPIHLASISLERPDTVQYSYTVRNTGNDAAQPFVVGFWRFLNPVDAPATAVLTVASIPFNPPSELVAQHDVAGLAPGQEISGVFEYNDLYQVDQGEYVFGIYADIHNTTTEPDENNSTHTIRVTINNGCG